MKSYRWNWRRCLQNVISCAAIMSTVALLAWVLSSPASFWATFLHIIGC